MNGEWVQCNFVHYHMYFEKPLVNKLSRFRDREHKSQGKEERILFELCAESFNVGGFCTLFFVFFPFSFSFFNVSGIHLQNRQLYMHVYILCIYVYIFHIFIHNVYIYIELFVFYVLNVCCMRGLCFRNADPCGLFIFVFCFLCVKESLALYWLFLFIILVIFSLSLSHYRVSFLFWCNIQFGFG